MAEDAQQDDDGTTEDYGTVLPTPAEPPVSITGRMAMPAVRPGSGAYAAPPPPPPTLDLEKTVEMSLDAVPLPLPGALPPLPTLPDSKQAALLAEATADPQPSSLGIGATMAFDKVIAPEAGPGVVHKHDVTSPAAPIVSTLAFGKVLLTPKEEEDPAVTAADERERRAWRVLVRGKPDRVGARKAKGALVVLVTLGAALLALRWQVRRLDAAWLARSDAALQLVLSGKGEAILEALPPGKAPSEQGARRHALARGAGLVLTGQHDPGLAALSAGQPALEELGNVVLIARLLTLRGQALLALGRQQEARAALEAATKRNPDESDAHKALGDLSLRGGDLGAAVRHYERAAGLDSRHAGVLSQVAHLRLERGDPQGALRSLKRLLEVRSDWVLRTALGDIQFALGRFDEARKAYDSALAEKRDALRPLLGMARLDLLLGELDRAGRWLDLARPDAAQGTSLTRSVLRAVLATIRGRALDAYALLNGTDPKDERAMVALANAQLVRGEAAAALKTLAVFDAKKAEAPRLLLALRAGAHLALDETVQAERALSELRGAAPRAHRRARLFPYGRRVLSPQDLKHLDSVVAGEVALAKLPFQVDPARASLRAAAKDSGLAALRLGQLEARAGERTAALDAFALAAKRAPNDPAPWLGRGRLLAAARKIKAAEGSYAEALRRDPTLAAARLERAELLLRLGNPSQARQELRACRGAVDPQRRALLLGRIAAALGDSKAAAARFRAALRLDPDDPRLLREAARAYLEAGMRDRALALLKKLSDEAAPGDPEVHADRARLLLAKGDVAGALEAADRVVALVASRPEGHVLRARCLIELDRLQEAGAALAAAKAKKETSGELYARVLLLLRQVTRRNRGGQEVTLNKLLARLATRDVALDLPKRLTAAGKRHAQAGRSLAAELAYAAVLTRDPRHKAAHHGLLAQLQGRRAWKALRDAAARLLAEFPEDKLGKESFDLAKKRLRRR